MAGPVLALQILSHRCLRKRYWPVLYDQSADPAAPTMTIRRHRQSAGAAVALFGNGLYPLYQLGLRDALHQAGRETLAASFWRVGYEGESRHLGTAKGFGWAEDLGSHLLAIERQSLQAVLLDRVREIGGEVRWEKKLQSLKKLPIGKTLIEFADGESDEVDIVAGADGAFSKVRMHILEERGPATADDRWLPESIGVSGVYGISSGVRQLEHGKSRVEGAELQTHGLWLDRGNLSTSPLPNDRMRWDLLIPEAKDRDPASHSKAPGTEWPTDTWESKILPGIYSKSYTAEVLRRHFGVYHPVTGSFRELVTASERIIHTPVRQRVWSEDEIQCGNAVVLGDASRTLPPSSGQGTSFAIEDATVLANVLLKHSSATGEQWNRRRAQALQEYASLRVPRSRRMAQFAWYASKLGMGETWYWRWLRDALSKMGSSSGAEQAEAWPFNERVKVDTKT